MYENPFKAPTEQPQRSTRKRGQIPLLFLGPIAAEFSYVAAFVALTIAPLPDRVESALGWFVVPLNAILEDQPVSTATIVIGLGTGFLMHVVLWWLVIGTFRWSVGRYSR